MRYNFFLYILVREDNTCFKVGISENITSRIRNLINFGPFNIYKTKLIPLYTKKKIREWEKEIKERYKKYLFYYQKRDLIKRNIAKKLKNPCFNI